MAVMEDTHHVYDESAPLQLANAVLAERLVAAVVKRIDPDAVASWDVTEMWQAFDRIERLGACAKTLLAARVEGSGSWRRAGARSAADHLAKLGGTSTSAARRSLENSKELPALPMVSAALRGGRLSNAQVDVIVPAAAADPSAQDRLVDLAHETNGTELKEECLRTKAAADPDPDATHERIRKERSARSYTDREGAWNFVARGTAEAGARFERALAPIIDTMFDTARAEDRHEAREAYVFDALMTLADRDAEPDGKSSSKNIRYLALIRVDAEALARGAVAGDEMCEIVGLGPIPVRVARELFGEAIVKLVITKGVDVVNVTHLGRGATVAQRIALLWSKPKCANVECSSMFVQLDHREPWAKTRHTRLDELDPLCPHDHKLKDEPRLVTRRREGPPGVRRPRRPAPSAEQAAAVRVVQDVGMQIRPFENDDEPGVIALWRDCDLTRPWNDPHDDIVRKHALADGLFLVGVVDDAVVATVMAGYEGHRGWINYLAVHPGRQRNGLARALMNEAERRLRALGCPKINLQIRTSNLGAVAFYERLGYVTDEVISMGRRVDAD